MDQFVLAELDHRFVSGRKWEVAVLPFGATEPHNYHLPYGTDIFQIEAIARRACAAATQAGASVLLLPTIPFGVNTNHLKIPGAVALSVTPSTLLKILTDLVDSLELQGIRKLLLLNGHGGNELKPLMRELHHKSSVFLCLCDWFRLAADQLPAIFERIGEHSDEVETSVALACYPHLVHLEQAGAGATVQSKLESIRKGWLSITRPWHLATTDTGLGDPRAASAEKGAMLVEVLSARLCDCLLDLSTAPWSANYPYG